MINMSMEELRTLAIEYSANEENGETQYERLDNWLHEYFIKTFVKNENWFMVAELMKYFFKESDCGKYGKIFEIMIKLYLNGYRGKSCIITPKGKVDVTYKGHKIEVKSNCGQLLDIRKSEYVVYTYDNEVDIHFPEMARVTTVDNFLKSLDNLGLHRQKKTTSGYTKEAIQSYKNSKKKYNAWTGTVDRWLKLEQVKSGLYEV